MKHDVIYVGDVVEYYFEDEPDEIYARCTIIDLHHVSGVKVRWHKVAEWDREHEDVYPEYLTDVMDPEHRKKRRYGINIIRKNPPVILDEDLFTL